MLNNPDRTITPAGNIRKYGDPPYKIAVIHGGPGAPGYMAPVARELAKIAGVLEPLQTEDSVDGQILELNNMLIEQANMPLTLIGSSWGAVLALLVAARKELEIKKLILVGSAVFDAASSTSIETRRLSRLDEKQRRHFDIIKSKLDFAQKEDLPNLAREWGDFFFDTDTYDPLTRDLEVIEVQYELNVKVWSEFASMRDRPGYLRSEFSKIDIPTVVIHGEHDPHPIDGIRPFLESCIPDIRFYILPECGHYPWIERQARERFFDILIEEIS